MKFGRRPRGEDGFAMLTAMLTGAVVTALAIAATAVAIDGTKSSRVDAATGRSLGAAESAVTRAMEYLHASNGGPRAVRCSPSCSANPWGNQTTPQAITFTDGSRASVWIEKQQEFAPPAYLTGTYIIHAVGTTADGKATRLIDETVAISPVSFPLGIYTDQSADFQGNGSLKQESLFSVSCITYRGNDHLNFDTTGVDAYYNIPPSAHSTSYITEANDNSCQSPTPAGHLHAAGPCNTKTWNQVSPTGTAIYDQSGYGGTYAAGSQCLTDPKHYATSSLFTLQMLKTMYGYRPQGLTPEVYSYLKQVAQQAGTYYTSTTPGSWPTASTSPHAVMYFDLSSTGTVTVGSQLDTYKWVDEAGSPPACNNDHPSVVIVVKNGGIGIDGNVSGSLFAPDGLIRIGNSGFIGTTFSKTFSTNANGILGLNSCFATNTTPVLLDPKSVHFSQRDQSGS